MTNVQKKYKKALMKAEYLLPDGIALQIFYFFAYLVARISKKVPKDTVLTKWLSNLNGTDFVPYFLDYIKKKNGPQSLCVAVYGTTDEYLLKATEKLQGQGYNIIYQQNGFSDFDWDALQHALSEYHDTINVLLVGRSTPTNPIQELWAASNYAKIKNNRLIVMNVGGLLDFLAGTQKRAPLWVRKLKLEWLYRCITDPKRNFKKVKNSLALFPYIFRYLLLKK
ncbi:MAG: hypothetical protein CR971_00860 [candidate division SR1 bacterium]|nr:MAG: hypothetical protein CR971_00860 [candidate division SR1 bacterium]